jgi:hypothetical protein
VFYMLVPGLLGGIVASLWLIFRGALGVFGHRDAETRTRPKAPRSQQ